MGNLCFRFKPTPEEVSGADIERYEYHSKLNPEELGVLGISVAYLSNQFMAEVRNAGFDETSQIYNIENISDFDEHGVIRRKGVDVQCPIDKKIGAAYVHSITNMADVGKADIILSYTWGYTIGDIVDTLIEYCKDSKLDPKNTFIWICCLCINQHRVIERRKCGEVVPFTAFRLVFDRRMKSIGHILAMMAPWQAPVYFTRVCCLLEILMANENDCNITLGMPSRERNKFMSVMRGNEAVELGNELFTAISSIDITMAKASEESDFKNILNLIEKKFGYDDFNVKVSGVVRKSVLDLIESEIVRAKLKMEDNSSKAQQCILLNNVGALFRHIGEYDRCLTIGQEALRMNDLIYGRENKHTARSLEVIGGALYFNHDKEEAMKFHHEVLAIRKNVLGPDHEDTAASIEWIAYILNDDGEKEEAMKMHKEALAVREKVFGCEHEKTAASLNFIATLLKDKGEKDEALKLYKKVLQIREKLLGREHTNTVETILSIANTLYEKGNLEEALKTFKEAFTIEEKIYGSNHPQTVDTREWIANLSYEIGNQQI